MLNGNPNSYAMYLSDFDNQQIFFNQFISSFTDHFTKILYTYQDNFQNVVDTFWKALRCGNDSGVIF